MSINQKKEKPTNTPPLPAAFNLQPRDP